MRAYCSGLCVVSTRLLKKRDRFVFIVTELRPRLDVINGRLFSGYYRLDSLKFHTITSSTEVRGAVCRVCNFVMLHYLEELCYSCDYICWYKYI